MIKNVTYKNKSLALIIRSTYLKKKGINFFTDNNLSQQVAFMNHRKNHTIQPHLHRKRLRKIYDTMEVLIILSGSLKVDFYNDKKKYLFSNKVNKNDILILLTSGHGFKILKNCKFIEVKQGPYNPNKDKFRF